MYKGWDVHAYSTQYREFMQREGLTFSRPVVQHVWDRLIRELKTEYSYLPAALVAIDKMDKRYDKELKGYFDADLATSDGNCNVARLLLDTWHAINATDNKEDKSVLNGFGEILSDIGTHCVQGDSHRLLNYYICSMEYHTPDSEMKEKVETLLNNNVTEEIQSTMMEIAIAPAPLSQVPQTLLPNTTKKSTPEISDQELLSMRGPLPYHIALLREELKAKLHRQRQCK